jgi:replication factor A1
MGKGGKGKGSSGEGWKEKVQYDHFTGDVKVCKLADLSSEDKASFEKASLVGVDYEWKGKDGPIALIGVVADGASVLLVRVGEDKQLPDCLEKCFKSKDVTKAIGGFWGPGRNDPRKLEDTFGLKFEDLLGFAGLSNMAEEKGIKKTSLPALAELFGWTMEKNWDIKAGDWEADELTDAQKQYAADDVWFTLQVYLKLKDYVAPPPKKSEPKFKKVKDINPDSKGLNLMLKCLGGPTAVEGSETFKEAVCGDETGIVTMSLFGEQSSLCKAGASLRVQNAHVKMIKGHVRLRVDKWGTIKAADEAYSFEVDEKNDISATEFELVSK